MKSFAWCILGLGGSFAAGRALDVGDDFGEIAIDSNLRAGNEIASV
jgi:hypothetical protein